MSKLVRCLIFAALIACVFHGEAPAEPNGPEGVEWRLVELGGVRVSVPDSKDQPSMMIDSSKKVEGFTGCNKFFGSCKIAGASVEFGPMGSTRKACAKKESGLEMEFFVALGSANRWKIDEGKLLLIDGEAVIARFIKEKGAK